MRGLLRGGVALGIALLVVLTGCGQSGEPPRDASGKITAPATANSNALRVGDCITSVSDLGGEVMKIPVTPCEQPHEAEIYAERPLTDAEGASSAPTIAQDFCSAQFQEFIGRPFDSESTLEITSLYPTPKSWDRGDRVIQCIVYDKKGGITGTLKGANR